MAVRRRSRQASHDGAPALAVALRPTSLAAARAKRKTGGGRGGHHKKGKKTENVLSAVLEIPRCSPGVGLTAGSRLEMQSPESCQYREVAASGTPVVVRPGERRACPGCGCGCRSSTPQPRALARARSSSPGSFTLPEDRGIPAAATTPGYFEDRHGDEPDDDEEGESEGDLV